MAISRSIKYATLDELLLDPKNPRLGRRNTERGIAQHEALEVIRGWEPEELAVSFLESGFWPQEALVVVVDPEVDEERFTVVEGNRRLGALKLLKQAYEGNPRTRRWRELAEVSAPPDLFEAIPYLLADSRQDVRKFLGFRHVTGIKEWAPAEKAQYIAELINSGMSYREVMRSIGSKTPTVRRNYIAFNILRQLEDLEGIDIEVVEDRFSVLFLGLRERGVQQFLGIDIDAEPEQATEPVPEGEYLENLEWFVRWVFGTAEVLPLFSDSRFMTKFARILEQPEAVEYLKSARSPSLVAAAAKAGADEDDLVERLSAATDELEQALSRVHLYRDRNSVRQIVSRLIAGVAALLNSFPDERAAMCADVESDR